MEESVLEHLGAEIMGIVSPVSICMAFVVLLVETLVPHGGDVRVSSIAMLVYDEQESDSFSEKLGGALLNALVFVAIITVVTFLLVALFYFRCTKFLKTYMAISAFMVLVYMGGGVIILLIQHFSIPIDGITLGFLLYNFGTVGVMALFFSKMPIVVNQGYLVLIGTLVAYWFTMLPEWTTWVILVVMALYDLVAVLVPGGPLNMLVELAVARDEEIPALVYEARPVSRHLISVPSAPEQSSASANSPSWPQPAYQPQRWRRRPVLSTANAVASGPNSAELGLAQTGQTQRYQTLMEIPVLESAQQHTLVGASPVPPIDNQNDLERSEQWTSRGLSGPTSLEEETVSLVSAQAQAVASATQSVITVDGIDGAGNGHVENLLDGVVGDGDEGILSGSVKLGLGDFIFYSVLVGRAAMYDLMTVYACYLAIIAGLGATLFLLAVWRRVLPALPISIALGLIFYCLTRLILDPFVANLGSHYVFF